MPHGRQEPKSTSSPPLKGSRRLDGWKAIADHLGRTVRTAQRWEREQALPVQRQHHNSLGSVYAFSADLSAWLATRASLPVEGANASNTLSSDEAQLVGMINHYVAQRTPEGFRKGIAVATLALRKNPRSAAIHAVLALAAATQSFYGLTPPAGNVALARKHVRRALALSPRNTEALIALALIRFYWERDWKQSRDAFSAALRYDPSHALAYHLLAAWYLARGEDASALDAAAKAEALAPQSLLTSSSHGWILHLAGRFDEAIAKARHLIARDPNYWRGYFSLALSLSAIGRLEEAREAIDLADALVDHPMPRLVRVHILGRLGETRAALRAMPKPGRRYTPQYWTAFAYMGLGDTGAAFTALERAVRYREWFVLFVRRDPAFHSLADTPRFRKLIKAADLR